MEPDKGLPYSISTYKTVLIRIIDCQGNVRNNTDMKTERFEMRWPVELLAEIDRWREEQAVLPPRAAAIRRLIELGLEVAHQDAQKPKA